MKRLIALCLLWLGLAVSPASAAWTVTVQGGGVIHNSSVHTVSTGNLTISANSLIILSGYARTSGSADPIVVTDGASDTFTVYQQGAGTGIRWMAWAVTAGLSAQTVSASDTSTGATNFTQCDFSIISATGGLTSSPEDTAVRANTTTASTTSPALTSGVPTQTGELFVGLLGFNGGLGAATITEDGAWTLINQRNDSVVSVSSGYFVNSGSSANTRTDTASVAHTYEMSVIGFFLNGGGAGVVYHGLSSSGAGK